MTKIILMHEYQHNSTRVNTSYFESARIRTSLTRIYMSQTRVNAEHYESTQIQHNSRWVNKSLTQDNMNEHKSKTGKDESTQV